MPANPPNNTAKRSLFLRKVCGFIRLCVCVQAMCECLQSVCEWKKLCWCSHVIFTCVLIWELENKHINTTLMHCRILHEPIIYFNENIFPVQFHTWAKYISQEAYAVVSTSVPSVFSSNSNTPTHTELYRMQYPYPMTIYSIFTVNYLHVSNIYHAW